MDWFSRYPKWLYSESIELSNNSIYREKYQFIDKTFISTGDILIHREKTERYPILIVYPKATPYISPVIYILKESLNEQTAKEFASKLPDEIRKAVAGNLWFFNRRHQNEDGSICFIETGDLHSDNAEVYPIKSIIKRLRTWLAGKIPKDSREVELFAHFKDRYKEMQYLLPDLFFDTQIVKGTFYAGISSVMPANYFSNNRLKKTYIGILISGETQGGIEIPPKVYSQEQLVLFAHIPNPKRIIQFLNGVKDSSFQKDIDDENVIEGYWWDINKEPEPFAEINRLAEYIGNGDKQEGFNELVNCLEKDLKKPSNVIHLGLRFPGRWREKDWQMLRLERGSRPVLVNTENIKEELKERLLDYSIKAVHQEYFTEEYFHMRNKGRADRNILKNIYISVIGCGALGSEISDCLNKAGIGRLLLVDKDEFKVHNSVRHCLGVNRVGFPKVLGLAEYLILHNPFVNVELKGVDILKGNLGEYLPEEFIGISTIADDNIESYLNEKAIENNKVVFYCRALRGGKTARIFRVKPKEDACKQCLSLYHNERSKLFIDIEEDENLPTITNECNNPVRPASAADLKLIASLTTRIIIEYIQQNKNICKNHWVWSSESIDKIKLDHSTWGLVYSEFIPPHPDCPICQKLEDKEIFIVKEAYECMKREVKISHKIETGGVLIGYIGEKGEYIIMRATGPGSKATKRSDYFAKDEGYCQKELEKAMSELGTSGIYLGEWHYHPTGSNSPSGLDIKSLTEIAQQDNYRIDFPILIILSPSQECALTIHDRNNRCVQLPFKIIDRVDSRENSLTLR